MGSAQVEIKLGCNLLWAAVQSTDVYRIIHRITIKATYSQEQRKNDGARNDNFN